jgi:hypothetical protein
MAISIEGLDPEPVQVPVGTPTPFMILGTGLKTKGLTVHAVKDAGGTPVDNVSLQLDQSRVASDNRLPVVAFADFGAVPGQYLVALKDKNTIEDTNPGLEVL